MVDHVEHLRRVFEILKQHQYVVWKDKCALAVRRIEYLRHFISAEGVSTNPRKIVAVQEWPSPKIIKQLKGFLGLSGYYRRFVQGYGILAKPLTNLLKKGVYQWNSETEDAFQKLKKALTTTPMLALPDLRKPFTIETDASHAGIGAVLMQEHHPHCFY